MDLEKKIINRNQLTLNIFVFINISIFLAIFFVGPDNYWFDNTKWLYESTDLTNSQLSWEYFKNDEWRFPIGKNPNYGLEVSNSIVYTDNIPILALFFKIFEGIIYNKFQYFSLWITLTFFFQLFFSYLLLIKATKNNLFSFFGSFLFLLCPFLFFRLSHHFSLGAHWLILYAFYTAYFVQEKQKEFHWYIIFFLSTLTHFYFTVMMFVIYSSFLLADIINKNNFYNIYKVIYKLLFVFTLMFLVGYFESSPINSISRGYGEFKLDLFGFFDPKLGSGNSWSIFLPDIEGTHLEGFNYIGLGLIVLFILAIFSLIKNNFNKVEISSLFKIQNLYILIFFIWSITTNPSVMGKEILKINLHDYIFGMLSIFGATGRFAWPVIYILIFVSLVTIFRKFKVAHAMYIIGSILFIQIADTGAAIKINSFKKPQLEKKDQIWNLIEKDFQKIKTTYLFNNYGPVYRGMRSVLGSMNNIKTNIILNAGMDRVKAAKTRYDFYEKITKKNLDADTAYIVDNKGHLINLKRNFINQNVGFFYRDDLWIMLPNKKDLMNKSDKKKIDQISFFKVDINKKNMVKFKKEYLGLGWTHNFPEEYGAWTEGKQAFLLISLNKSQTKFQNKLKLDLDITPFNLNKNENYALNIYINNNQERQINFYNNKNSQIVHVDLDKNLLEQDLLIKFELTGLISPYKLRKSPDARELGILLKSFEVKEIK